MPAAELTARQQLATAWARLLPGPSGPAAEAVGARLLDDWGAPDRHYHDLRHLQRVLDRIDELAGHAADPTAVRLAAWYHDAVYHGDADDEENSARRAEEELRALGLDAALVTEVARLVRLTARHDPVVGDRNGAVLCDADLAILAAPAAVYAGYADAVRTEYGHVPDAQFRARRAAILRDLLAAPSLFRTPLGRTRWETTARENIATELHRLTGRGSGGGAGLR